MELFRTYKCHHTHKLRSFRRWIYVLTHLLSHEFWMHTARRNLWISPPSQSKSLKTLYKEEKTTLKPRWCWTITKLLKCLLVALEDSQNRKNESVVQFGYDWLEAHFLNSSHLHHKACWWTLLFTHTMTTFVNVQVSGIKSIHLRAKVPSLLHSLLKLLSIAQGKNIQLCSLNARSVSGDKCSPSSIPEPPQTA